MFTDINAYALLNPKHRKMSKSTDHRDKFSNHESLTLQSRSLIRGRLPLEKRSINFLLFPSA